jgi:hypothetical protein
LNPDPKTKTPGFSPGLFENKNPGWRQGPPGVLTIKFLALTCRMDASKAKKEAPEIKISFCGEFRVHFGISIDNWK